MCVVTFSSREKYFWPILFENGLYVFESFVLLKSVRIRHDHNVIMLHIMLQSPVKILLFSHQSKAQNIFFAFDTYKALGP